MQRRSLLKFLCSVPALSLVAAQGEQRVVLNPRETILRVSSGEELGREHLRIYVRDRDRPVADEVTYALYEVAPNGEEILVGPVSRTPVSPATGEYYAALAVPTTARGSYRVWWSVGGEALTSQNLHVAK